MRVLSREQISVLVTAPTRMDCELLRLSLKRSPYAFQVTACACDSSELLAAVRQRIPDVALISANLLDGPLAGLKMIRELRNAYPTLPMVVLFDKGDRELVTRAFRAGARGTFSRSETFDDLCKCIHQVRHGQVWASAHELHYVLEALATTVPLRAVDADGNNLLTKREEEVVKLVADGLTNREVGEKLKLSEHTVKNYLYRIFDKLGISSRVELILYAMTNRSDEENRQRIA